MKFVAIYSQTNRNVPATFEGRKHIKVARQMMQDAIRDLEAQGQVLTVKTDKRIVTNSGRSIWLQ